MKKDEVEISSIFKVSFRDFLFEGFWIIFIMILFDVRWIRLEGFSGFFTFI